MPPVKPYRTVPIRDCGEALTLIPPQDFAFVAPHPYVALGAPYGKATPWMLRTGVLAALKAAQTELRRRRPGWNVLLFDALRPNAVQAFMVAREFALQAANAGLNPNQLTPMQRDELDAKVFRLFAIPSDDPATPPPHSTGAALDCTLIDAAGREVDMGSPIDENSPRSMPDHFATATDEAGRQANVHRILLHEVMQSAGFVRNPSEWWHFSRGDQLAVWAAKDPNNTVAIYGRAGC